MCFLVAVLLQVIVSIEIPFASSDTVFRSYKVMPRSEVRTRACLECRVSCVRVPPEAAHFS